MIICLNRLVKHPLAYTIKDYINSFRTKLSDTITKQQIEPVRTDFNLNAALLISFLFQLRYDRDGRPYQIATGKT